MKTSLFAMILWLALSGALDEGGYLPCKTKAGDEGIMPFAAECYAKSLARMHEPKLPSLADEVHAIAYRLLILPNYANPIVVRVNKRGSIYRVSARRLNGSGGYDPGELVEAKDAELTVTDSKKLDGLLQDLNFPQLPTEDDARGHDTDEWILEGVAKGKYHVIQRRCVTDETQKRKLSAFLKLC